MNHDVKRAALRLVNANESIMIRPDTARPTDPIMCQSWDLGAPDMRYTSVPNPGADGVTESAGFLSARTVVLDLQILGDRHPDGTNSHDAYWYADRLIAMTHPTASPQLEIRRKDETTSSAAFPEGEIWRMRLRGNPHSLAFGSRAAALLELQLSFQCTSGILEGPIKRSDMPPGVGGGTVEWKFDAKFPKTFSGTLEAHPVLTVDVGGELAVYPVIYISGPCTDPELRSVVVRTGEGEVFRFEGLTLATGETIQIDMGAGSIRYSRADGTITDDMSVYGAVDWGVSTFWTWLPEPHQLRFMSSTGSVTVELRERRLNI
jgi:hypothetical protein